MDPSTDPLESPAIVSARPPICRMVTSLILFRSKRARSARSVTAPNLVIPTFFPLRPPISVICGRTIRDWVK